LTLC